MGKTFAESLSFYSKYGMIVAYSSGLLCWRAFLPAAEVSRFAVRLYAHFFCALFCPRRSYIYSPYGCTRIFLRGCVSAARLHILVLPLRPQQTLARGCLRVRRVPSVPIVRAGQNVPLADRGCALRCRICRRNGAKHGRMRLSINKYLTIISREARTLPQPRPAPANRRGAQDFRRWGGRATAARFYI